MAELLRVPEVAAGTTEAVFSEWLVAERELFKAGDPIAVIETDKAQVEVEAEADAVILKALVTNGALVQIGAPMAVVGSESELGDDIDELLERLQVTAPELPRRDVPDDHDVSVIAPVAAAAVSPPALPAVQRPTGRLFISPLARRMLSDAGLSPESVPGSGPRGRILRRDVERAIAAARVTPAPTVDVVEAKRHEPARAAGAGYREDAHSRLRRAVAQRLTESKQTVPHFYLRRTAQFDDLLALRADLNAILPVRLSVNDFVLRAVAVAHNEVPEANVVWTDEALRQFDSVDIAVAVASERGLVTPVLRAVENSSLGAISASVRSLVDRANAGTLRQQDLEGGSITVTNLGMYDVDEFAAIINPPHSAILAVGAARPTPVAKDHEVSISTSANLVLSVDHRAIDGALAARWMGALVHALENPLRLVV